MIRAQRERRGVQRNLEGSVEELARHGARGRAYQAEGTPHANVLRWGSMCCYGETMRKPVSLERRKLRGVGER